MKRQKLVHDHISSQKLTMREGIIRVLEHKIDPNIMGQPGIINYDGNLSEDDEVNQNEQQD
jgi:hypothetical protein